MRAAILGVGFMGWIHSLAYRRSDSAEFVGFASRDPIKRAGDWRGIQGNFGPPGEQFDVSDLVVCEGLEGLLEDDSIDLIDVCLPPHLHVDAVTRSLRAGKRVLCEKPLALTSADGQSMTDLAQPGQLMVGHILPLMPEFAFLVDAASDGRFGKILAGRFQRTIGPPDWIPDFYDPLRVGGPLIDLQVHDAHLIRMLFGMPSQATTASELRNGIPKRYETLLHFDQPADSTSEATTSGASHGGGQIVSVCGGVIDSPARPFTHGYEVSFEKATVRFEFAAYSDGGSDLIPVTVLHQDGRREMPPMDGSDPIDAFVAEIDAAASVVAGGSMPPALDPQLATDALRICEMQMPKS